MADLAGAQAQHAGSPQQYQALYRRYRPQRFADVRGQEHVTRALRNAVRDSRVAHAYLFSGPRGTGKTSTARILAMALNCQSPADGEPDGTCASCLAVRSGSSMDVFELDAASNRKLDEMRDLLSRVALGTPGRWKVYIIDEVHQLTADAASALLKTLEEPPGHVVFVLATTDPQKVLPTIKSRAQHFEFHLLDGDLLEGLLSDINEDAGLGLSAEAVKAAVQKGRGSARDAESALEQLAAAGGEAGGEASVKELAEALAERDVRQVLEAVARAVSAGREPRRLGNDLVEHLRNAFLAQQAPSLVLVPEDAKEALSALAHKMGLAFLVRCMETVGQALVDMRDSADPRVTLEVAMVRLASPAADASPEALLERIERLERAAGAPVPVPPVLPGAPMHGPPELKAALAPRPTLPGTVSASAATRTSPPATPMSASAGPFATPATPGAPATPATPAAPAPPAAPISSPGGALAASSLPGPAQAKVALGALLKQGSPQPVTSDLPGAQGSAAQARGGGSPVPPAPSGTGTLPSRDQLSKAWGDSVLSKLSRAAQVYMASGRFTEVSGGVAVFALPDKGLLTRALAYQAEAETVLAAHLGQGVPLRLVVDPGPGPALAVTAPAPEDLAYDLDQLSELQDAPAVPEVPAEQRILEAFPGAVLDG